ncbi:MAG: type II toxin-antitoxin system VapC family toxin [Chitinophagales bacterium]
MKQAILDTDTVSYYFRDHTKVIEKIDTYLVEHGFVHISVVTYYEIMNGLMYKDARRQLAKFERFVRLNNVIPLTLTSAKVAAGIYANLRKTGKPIGHNDVMIAGIAIDNDLVLVPK